MESNKTYKVFKTQNGYKLTWFAERGANWTGGVGLIDDEGNAKPAEHTIRAKGMCECILLSSNEFGKTERNLIKKAIYSAIYALDFETFLYDDKQRNEFINYVLKNKIKITQLDVTDAWTQTDIVITNPCFAKRCLIQDGIKVADLIDENYERKYAFYTDIEIINEEN